MGRLGRVLERLGLILERLGGVLERLGRVLNVLERKKASENPGKRFMEAKRDFGRSSLAAPLGRREPTISNEEGNLLKENLY